VGPNNKTMRAGKPRPASIPDTLGGLWELANDLSWTWNPEAPALFRAIDPPLWRRTRHNPVALLRNVGEARWDELAADDGFRRRYDAACRARDRVSGRKSAASTWFARSHPEFAEGPVAYFCAEFALHE